MNTENITIVRVFAGGWRDFVGLTDYSCRKIDVKQGSIVDTQSQTGRGVVYSPIAHNNYTSTGLVVDCLPTTALED